LMPTTRALAKPNQAVHSAKKPKAQRPLSGNAGHPAGPAFKAHAPPNTQTKVAIHQINAGARVVQPAANAAAQAQANSAPKTKQASGAPPFKRAHSQPAAAINTKVNNAKGQAALANRAGSSNANKTKAVTTRCASMVKRCEWLRRRTL
jgi:hypothetical protein